MFQQSLFRSAFYVPGVFNLGLQLRLRLEKK